MSHHITINGRTYASVDEMPVEVRRQYQSAIQMLTKTGSDLAHDATGSDINISTRGSDPLHPAFKTITKMTARRVVINGKEYSRWEDVPAEAREALHGASVGMDAQNHLTAQSLPTQISYQAKIDNMPASFDSSKSVSLGLGTFVVLLLLAVLGGMLVGWKFLH